MKKLLGMASLFLLVMMGVMSCTSPVHKIKNSAKENLRLTLGDNVKILGVSRVDSAFGINYFTPDEMHAMLSVMKKVTDQIMTKTDNMRNFSRMDAGFAALIQRQFRAADEVRGLIFNSNKKGKFSGYKLKIDYEDTDAQGISYRAERWFFFSPDGSQILKTFDVPLL